jgi:Ni/Co efflux regulator RcnB
MKERTLGSRLAQVAFIPVLIAAVSTSVAQGPPPGHGPDHSDRHDYDHHDNGHHRGQDFHFRDEDRRHFEPHYQKDIERWRSHPHGRPQFIRGQRIPPNYRFQPVPRTYYAEVPPPPPGYQYGYYDGYVVAYDPTTRIVADVLDLVGAAVNR